MNERGITFILSAAAYIDPLSIAVTGEPPWKMPIYRGRRGRGRKPAKCARHYELELIRRRQRNRAARNARKITRPKYTA